MPRPDTTCRGWALIVAATILAAACGTTPPESTAPAPVLSLQLETRIGCGECDDERQITPVAVALLDDDRVGVLDLYEPFVRLFGGTGDLDVTFGQKGQGPGELGMDLPGVNIYQPGIWLLGNPEGGATVVGIMPVVLDAFDSSGAFLGQTPVDVPMAVPVAQAFDRRTRTYYQLSFDPTQRDGGRVIWRCRFPPSDETGCSSFTTPQRFLESEGSPGSRPGDLALAATPDGSLVVANTSTYRVWVLDEDAEIAMQTVRDIPFPAKSEAELAGDRDAAARMGRPESSIEPSRPHIQYAGVQVDGAGRIWILTARFADDNSVFDVFAPDGTYLAEVEIDAVVRRSRTSMTLFTIDGDRLATIARQPDGNEEVWVWRIVSG